METEELPMGTQDTAAGEEYCKTTGDRRTRDTNRGGRQVDYTAWTLMG